MAFILPPTIAISEPQLKDVRTDEQGDLYLYVELDTVSGASVCFRGSAEARVLADACQKAAETLAAAEAEATAKTPLLDDHAMSEIDRARVQAAREENI